MNIFDLTLFFSRLQEYVIQPNGTLTPLNSMQNYLLSEQQAGEILAQVTGQPGDLVLGRSFSVVGVGGGAVIVFMLFLCAVFFRFLLSNSNNDNNKGNIDPSLKLRPLAPPCCLPSRPPPALLPCTCRFSLHRFWPTTLLPVSSIPR